MALRFLFRKGAVEIILYLHEVGKANYYAVQRQGFVGSRQTFSNLLKELEARGIISRRVVESRPPRVEYSLTEKGRRVAEILEQLKAALSV
ncbi:MAG: winged helix-turn-helix transcriptional regulator [Candidatus Freyarchaeota archaeon]